MLLQIEIPEITAKSPTWSKQDLLLDIAVSLYQRRVYSLAKAARFAGLNRLEFQRVLAARQISVVYDLKIDIDTLAQL